MASPASTDEGEIIETEVETLKATSLPKKLDGSGVDPQDRLRGRYSVSKSPEYDSYDRSRRSRSPRGFKRTRDDRDSYSGGRRDKDSRHTRARYEDRDKYDQQRSRKSYDDLDRPASRGSNHSHGARERDWSRDRDRYRHHDRDRDRDWYHDKRPRKRSRSPYRTSLRENGRGDRSKREEGRLDRPRDRNNASMYDDYNDQDSRDRGSTSKRSTVGDVSHAPKESAKPGKGIADSQHAPRVRQEDQKERAKAAEPEDDYEEPQVIDEEAEIERRRRRRDALLAKSSSATPLLVHALHEAAISSRSSPGPTQQSSPQKADFDTPLSGMASKLSSSAPANRAEAGSPASGPQDEPSPDDLDMFNERDLGNARGKAAGIDEDGPSAADYDPTVDMKEDELRDEMRHGNVGFHGEALPAEGPADEVRTAMEEQPRNASEDADGDFDMFAEDFGDKYVAAQPTRPAVPEVQEEGRVVAQPVGGGILEGDDKDGYYKIRHGEVINGRYQIQSGLGKGMFSGVARAIDIKSKDKKLAAIKIIRNNDALRKGGYTEIAILQKLNAADPDNRKHIVKFERHFEHMGHLCMAFENLSLNLREVLKKFGNNVGINLDAVRVYAHQIFVGLAHMRKCSIIHADLKPDNILVNERRNILKICDLGTAIDRSDAATAHNEITPYLVSRFYRAPEIILGMPYDYAIDVWSIGCTLYELYTGKILFTGDSNNQMLKAIMEIRGRLTPKLYKRGQLSGMHFDDAGNFVSVERDKALGKTTVRTLAIAKPTRDLRTRLLVASSGLSEAENRDLNQFVDLLEHCLTLNPDKRIKPLDALKHPFFTSRVGSSKR